MNQIQIYMKMNFPQNVKHFEPPVDTIYIYAHIANYTFGFVFKNDMKRNEQKKSSK